MTLDNRMTPNPREESEAAVHDAIANLVLAAREDDAFRQRVLLVLKLPAEQRESLVKSAVEEMRLRGEPATIRAAFLALATTGGAAAATRLLERE